MQPSCHSEMDSVARGRNVAVVLKEVCNISPEAPHTGANKSAECGGRPWRGVSWQYPLLKPSQRTAAWGMQHPSSAASLSSGQSANMDGLVKHLSTVIASQRGAGSSGMQPRACAHIQRCAQCSMCTLPVTWQVWQLHRQDLNGTWCLVSRRRMARVFLVRRSRGRYFCSTQITHRTVRKAAKLACRGPSDTRQRRIGV